MVVRFRATLAYDGTAYQGYQRQAEGIPTIQAALETAIQAVIGRPVGVTAAGRTDTGVHATGQVIAFDADWFHSDEALLRAINANLPDDIVLQDICQHPDFHPRFDAISRLYRYTVLYAPQPQPLMRNRVWWVYQPLDIDSMQALASEFIGEHDFATFGQPPQGEITVRTVYRSAWTVTPTATGQLYVYEVEANAFLYHMVRRLVGMQVNVGRGRQSISQAVDAFRRADISLAKLLAPPHGLILECVRYRE